MLNLYLIDEVKVKFEGLSQKEIKYIIDSTKNYVKGYFQTAAFKIGEWDGKESFFMEDGFTFYYMLDKVFPLLENLGYNVDTDIEVHDLRDTYTPPEKITEGFLGEYGIILRDLQYKAVNAVIDNEKGILNCATSSGKTKISLCLSKIYDSVGFKSLNIVPSQNLRNQTYNEYDGKIDGVYKITDKDSVESIKEALEKYRHFIVTWQKLNNITEALNGFVGVLIVDEVHRFGDVLCNITANELSDCPIRVGMTGTVPKDKNKREKVCCHIGGDVIYNVEASELMEEGLAAQADITMIETDHKRFHQEFDQSKWDWTKEQTYLNNNKERVIELADYINNLQSTNTLVLCSRQMAENLHNETGIPYIDGDVKADTRQYYYDLFENNDGVKLIASYGTSSVGISIDRIFRLVLIDVGKDFSTVVQSIGRGIRKDGVFNKVEVLDISADSKYSLKHKKERIKIYDKHKYNYTVSNQTIII